MSTQTIHPEEYLQDGMFDAAGNLLPGINGEYSLAMAIRLAEDGFGPSDLQAYKKEIAESMETHFTGDPHGDLSQAARDAFAVCAVSFATRCPALEELIDAAEPHVTDWTRFAFFLDHVERMTSQLALVAAYAEISEKEGDRDD